MAGVYHSILSWSLLLLSLVKTRAFYFSGATCYSRGHPVQEERRDGDFLLTKENDDNVAPLNTDDIYNTVFGLYIHIPYCRRRCRYCSFAIVPIGSKVQTEFEFTDGNDGTGTSSMTQGFLEMDQSYRKTLLQEINLLRNERNQQGQDHQPIILTSLYFGGGTPSLAPLETIQAVLDALLVTDDKDEATPLFVLAENSEISVEMDPGTFSLQKLKALQKMGFNRISLGVQSFDDTILESIGRVHRKQDVMDAIEMIQTVFGDDDQTRDEEVTVNYSIDLISGLPGLTHATWAETLETAVALKPRPTHISLYDLQVETGTVFGKWYGNNDSDDDDSQALPSRETRGSPPIQTRSQLSSTGIVAALPSEEDCASMYKYASGYLKTKGYEHYEVSSYAYVGSSVGGDGNSDKSKSFEKRNRSQHNQIYWSVNGNWFALGLGATSFVNGKMTARPRTLVDYSKWVDQQTRKSQQESKESDTIDKMDFLTDVIMKRLRTSDGLDLDWISDNYGRDCLGKVMKGASLGLDLGLMVVNGAVQDAEHISHGTLSLTDPDGFLYSNNLISSIFVELGDFQDC